MQINEKSLKYKKDKTYTYNDIPIYAEKGVHEGVFEAFIWCNFSRNSKILILWAWAWAFDQRLLDAWYKNILSVDIEVAFYRAANKNIKTCNLNQEFVDLGKFDVIFAIEIIEHLENQFHFVKNIELLLNDDNSRLFLTTPNIENFISKFSFFFSWKLNSFSESSLNTLGHINPIFIHIFLYNIEKHKLSLIWKEDLARLGLNFSSIRATIGSIFYALVWIFWRKNNSLVTLFILAKNKY